VTTAVGVEVAVLEPALLEAVTARRSLKPTSPGPSRYVCEPVPTPLQALPVLSHRCHWYE
jgi:hypothetical protein